LFEQFHLFCSIQGVVHLRRDDSLFVTTSLIEFTKLDHTIITRNWSVLGQTNIRGLTLSQSNETNPVGSLLGITLRKLWRLRKSFHAAPTAEKSWRGLDGHKQLPKIILGVRFVDGMEVVRSQGQAAAA
jgi:hypothetical protein